MTIQTLAGIDAGDASEDAIRLPEPRFSPGELADILGERNRPTDEQSAIIASPLTPRLVIAGAGSGKTATMADRVVWLVANGWVRPEEVLGVTFTRKAAGELASRIRAKLATLQRIAASDNGQYGFPEGVAGSDELEPKVSTYHSYASGIVADYGLRLGIERDVVLLGGAQAWQLASEVVEAYDGDYEHFTAAKSTLVNAVMQLASECAEHLRDPAEVQHWLMERVSEFAQLPYQSGAKKNATQAAGDLGAMLRTRASVADMVRRYQEAKKNRGVLDFGDLVALAAKIAREIPLAAATERARYKVVLLDEFQDTSHAQLVLFSRLFGGGHAVTAVGDPNQSIYGFRGASAGQLFHFVQEFPVRVEDSFGMASLATAPTSYLTTAWRNGRNILATANVISAPLNSAPINKVAPNDGTAGMNNAEGPVAVPPLQPSPAAVNGNVVLGRFATDEDEAAAIARDVHRYRRTVFETAADGAPVSPTMAVLCRRRAQMECLRREFDIQGIPYEIVGLGGLLDTPEVVDLVAALRVLADPGRSDALMRLLAGARWRIGTADLMAFRDWSRFLARRRSHRGVGRGGTQAGGAEDHGAEDYGAEDYAGTDESQADAVVESDITDAASLVEALDYLPRPGWTSGHGRSLSEAALERLGRLSMELRDLRGFIGDDLSTLLGEVERAMLLDIEVAAKPGTSIHQARRNLDAFHDAAASFLQTSQRVDLLAFLGWLEAAASEEGGLNMADAEVNPEAVQLLTVHASKGLEWDVVFVPGLNAGAFPSNRDSRWSSGTAALPWPLRGDRADLPQWDLDQPDQKGWLEAEKDFKSEVQHHGEAEERRLAYVAYTRAKFVLCASSAVWNGSRAGIAETSPFLAELACLAGDAGDDAGGAALAAIHPQSLSEDALPTESPLTVGTEVALFPYDPLEGPSDPRTGERLRLVPGRRATMEAAATRVRDAVERLRADSPLVIDDSPPGTPPHPSVQQLRGPAAGWAAEAELLLERQLRRKPVQDVHLPGHISASMFVDLGDDPAAVLAQLRRPVPRQPGISARKGTAFHSWVEEYFGTTGMLDLDDAPGSDSHIDEAYGLDDMVATFTNSEWAHRAPAFVEVPVETRIGDVVVRGRIDAVFRAADGTWELVDWKTGKRPAGRQLKTRAVQLAVYRLAWARLKGVPLEQVSAAFYYVADDAVVRPHDLGTAEELENVIASALGRS